MRANLSTVRVVLRSTGVVILVKGRPAIPVVTRLSFRPLHVSTVRLDVTSLLAAGTIVYMTNRHCVHGGTLSPNIVFCGAPYFRHMTLLSIPTHDFDSDDDPLLQV